MALKLNIVDIIMPELLIGVLKIEGVNEVYLRIDRFSGEGNICRFVLGYYNRVVGVIEEKTIVDNEEVIENKEVVTFEKLNFPEIPYQFELVEDGSELDVNVRKQGYEYLKTLPEFEGCEDC